MERKRKIELFLEGVRRRYFQDGNRPEDVLDCGVHSGRKIEDVYLDHESYVRWVLELKLQMWSMKVRETRLEMSESLVEEMAAEEKHVVEEFARVRWTDLEEEEQD